jgi:HSP20 family protein
MNPFPLKKTAERSTARHAAITLKAAQCKGRTGTHSCHAHHFQRQEFPMFFAPALRTRSYAPAARGFDRGFERFLNDAVFANGLKVEQDDQAWTVTLDLPGIAREQLKVDIEGAIVRIETVADAKRSFKAAYELPEEIDAEASAAKLENGVLTLTLGKKKPVSNARTIEVK